MSKTTCLNLSLGKQTKDIVKKKKSKKYKTQNHKIRVEKSNKILKFLFFVHDHDFDASFAILKTNFHKVFLCFLFPFTHLL